MRGMVSDPEQLEQLSPIRLRLPEAQWDAFVALLEQPPVAKSGLQRLLREKNVFE